MKPTMYPEGGPARTESHLAEPLVYNLLANQLSSEFVVIHSLPWLNLEVGQQTRRFAPIGEADFVILHPTFGILLLEVKGGTWRFNGNTRVFELLKRTQQGEWVSIAHRDVIKQVKDNVMAIQEIVRLCDGLKYQRIGHALFFPECDMQVRPLPSGLYDPHTGDTIVLDVTSCSQLASEIERVMRYWKKAFHYPDKRGYQDSEIGREKIDRILSALSPMQGYDMRLITQIRHDKKQYLTLRPEQLQCLVGIRSQQRSVLCGGSGTGKTLLATEYARQRSIEGLRVLLLTFNRLLREQIAKALQDSPIQVSTIDHLRWKAASHLGYSVPDDREQKENILNSALDEAFQKGHYLFDVLIIDEVQSFYPVWLKILVDHFRDKYLLVCCDETQIFEHERVHGQYCDLKQVLEFLDLSMPFYLSLNLRSPYAVFDRLSQLSQPISQRYSLRNPDPAGLQEIMAQTVGLGDNFTVIGRVVNGLHNEGVLADDITVLGPPRIETYLAEHNLRNFVGTVTTIHRFRGCESPIVIVWWNSYLDSPTLQCAYARATTRCIVAYTEFALRGQLDTKLGQALQSAHVPDDIHRALVLPSSEGIRSITDEFIQSALDGDIFPIARVTAYISWSQELGGWLLEEEFCPDKVAIQMWRDALIFYSNFSVFLCSATSTGIRRIQRFLPSTDPYQKIKAQHVREGKCINCHQTKLGFSSENQANDAIECFDCLCSISIEVPEAEITRFVTYESILTNWDDQNAETKRSLPLPLFALARWHRCACSPGRGHLDIELSMMQSVCRTFVFADVCDLEYDARVTASELKNRYQRWYPALYNQIDLAKWDSYIDSILNGLHTRKYDRWLHRQEPKNAKLFARLSDPLVFHEELVKHYDSYGFASRTDALWGIFFQELCETHYYWKHNKLRGFVLPRLNVYIILFDASHDGDAREPANLIADETGFDVLLFQGDPESGNPQLYISKQKVYEGRELSQLGWQIRGGILQLVFNASLLSKRLIKVYEIVRQARHLVNEAEQVDWAEHIVQ